MLGSKANSDLSYSPRSSEGARMSQSKSATATRKLLDIFGVAPISLEAPCDGMAVPLIVVDDMESSLSFRQERLYSDESFRPCRLFGSSSGSASLEPNNECEAIKTAEHSLQVMEEMKRIFEERENSHRQAMDQLEKNFDEQMAPLISNEVLDRRLELLENLNSHARTIIENGPSLVDKLKQRITTDVLPIKYDAHRCVVEYCDLMVDNISNFGKHIETIRWFGDKNVKKNINMESYVDTLNRAVVTMELNLKALVQFRTALEQLRTDKSTEAEHQIV